MEIELQKHCRVIGWPAHRLSHHPIEAKASEIKLADKGLDDTDWIIL